MKPKVDFKYNVIVKICLYLQFSAQMCKELITVIFRGRFPVIVNVY